MRDDKDLVREFWNRASCGEAYAMGRDLKEALGAQARTRYSLEPFIREFAGFWDAGGKDILEVGVGMGADHLEWARARPASLTGVDLSTRAIDFTQARLAVAGEATASRLLVADAEDLPFRDGSFDVVYSWGVLHHSPDTKRAIQEVRRVLREGGVARVMIYHRWSIVGVMLWIRYALLRGRPGCDLDSLYATHLESPGTKAYSVAEARNLFRHFKNVKHQIRLSPGDLLDGASGQRHQGALLAVARRVWPRWIIRRSLRRFGLFLLIEAHT